MLEVGAGEADAVEAIIDGRRALFRRLCERADLGGIPRVVWASLRRTSGRSAAVRYEKVRAVVLGSRPMGEADRVLRLFTRELGRVDAVVKGVRKTTSRWGGRLEPYAISDLMLYQGRSLYTVTQAQLVDVFRRLREDREGLAAAAVRLRGRRRPVRRARA